MSAAMKYALLAILAASTLLPATSLIQAAEFSRETYGNAFGYLNVTGRIVEGDFERFKQFAPRSTSDRIQIVLDSPGGSVREGVAIGRYIYEHQLDTTVRRACVSVCALVWLAGNPRHVTFGAGIGFHAAYDSNGTSGVGNAFIGAYLRDIGMPLGVIVYATSAPPEGMNWLTPAKANELGLKITVLSRGVDPPPVPPTPPAPDMPATKCKHVGQNLYRC
jgi:hypothetical protein